MVFRYLGAATVVATFIAMPATALAQAREGIRYDCDTAANHFSELLLPAGPAPFIVTGKVKLMTVGDSKDYVPMTLLSIGSASDGTGPANGDIAGFEYLVAPAAKGKKPGLPFLAFVTRKAGKEKDTQMIAPPSSGEVAFTLVYDGADVAVTIDGHVKKYALEANRPAVAIHCSTGEFLYSDLLIRPLD